MVRRRAGSYHWPYLYDSFLLPRVCNHSHNITWLWVSVDWARTGDGPDGSILPAPGSDERSEAGNLERNEPTLNCRCVPNGIGIRNRKIELASSFYASPPRLSRHLPASQRINADLHQYYYVAISMDRCMITSLCASRSMLAWCFQT